MTNMNDQLTAKQVAQLYYLDEIITHEVILEAYNTLKTQIEQHRIKWSETDIMYKLCTLAAEHELSKSFNLKPRDIGKTIQSDYQSEVSELTTISTL